MDKYQKLLEHILMRRSEQKAMMRIMALQRAFGFAKATTNTSRQLFFNDLNHKSTIINPK